MQRLVFSILFTLSLALANGLAQAAIVLSPQSSGSSLNEQIELLEDVGAQLTIRDMADPAVQSRFQPAAGRATVGQSRNPWWIKVTLQRTAGTPSQWWLENAGITIYNLQLYLPDGQGGWSQRETGEAVPYLDGRDYAYRRMVFKLPEIGEQPLTLYFRSLDPAGNSFPLKIWQLPDLAQQAGNENIGFRFDLRGNSRPAAVQPVHPRRPARPCLFLVCDGNRLCADLYPQHDWPRRSVSLAG